jgi:pyruvate/2-oxoglutarate dehydrogenase complex dihydrolipoamide acyltransferase (E2) component
MPTNILMPESMAGGTLARWLKRVGDRVGIGDVIAEVETDKATMQIESPHAGVLAEIHVSEGNADLAADTVLAVVHD